MQIVVSLLIIMLLLIPLFALLFGSLSFAESLSYVELMIVHGVSRKQIINGKFIGLGSSLALSFLCGAGLGLATFLNSFQSFGFILLLLGLGVLLNYIFLGLALILSTLLIKKEVILASALFIWFYIYILYDFIIMSLAVLLREYPLEVPILIMVFLNPLDLVRVILLLNLNLASSMSIGAALIEKILSGSQGILLAIGTLCLWIYGTWKLTETIFLRKDL